MWTSPYFDDGAGNQLMITYAKPFFIDGSYCGIVTIDILLDNIKKLLLLNEKRIEGEFDPDLYVVNAIDSIIIYSERSGIPGIHALSNTHKEIIYDLKTKLSILELILDNESGSGIVKTKNGQSYFVFHARVVSCDWIIIDILNVSQAQSFVYKSISRIVLFIMIFLSSLVVIIFATSRLITRPLSKLSDLSIEISNGNYSKEIKTNRKDEIGTLAINFKQMIGKLVERENSLRDANKQLLVLDEAKNEFLQLISHEIRTPLNGIVGSTHFLNDIIEDPELKEFLDMLKESVERLNKFSKTALEITEMQTVGRDAKKTMFSTSEIIRDVINELKPGIDKKQLSISTDFCDKDNLLGVNEYFRRSIVELLENAIRFSHEKTLIEIITLNENTKFRLSITDIGEIISADKVEKIIKPFGLGKEHYDKHTGLGLTYIQKFLDIHDASIEIISNIEKTEIALVFNNSDQIQ
jgi:signal transduction histidine kinase